MNFPEQQFDTDFKQYELQAIMADCQLRPTWFELLYRPTPQITDVESYFLDLSDEEKIAFDIDLFRHLPKIQHRHKPYALSINLNPVSLLDDGFLKIFTYILETGRLTCDRVCIEIVESGVLTKLPRQAESCLRHFKSLGGQIALDDFGTGSTHWELINNNWVDVIKIATHKHKGDDKHRILTALSEFSNSLQLTTVFEGIESKQDLEDAKTMGATHFQGWYFNQWKILSS